MRNNTMQIIFLYLTFIFEWFQLTRLQKCKRVFNSIECKLNKQFYTFYNVLQQPMQSFKQKTIKTTLNGDTPTLQQKIKLPGCSENIERREEDQQTKHMEKESCTFQLKLKETISNIQQNDYSYSYGRQQVIDILRTLREQNLNMPKIIRQDAQYLLDLIKFKIQSYDYSNIIYRQLLQESYKLSQALFYDGDRRRVKVREHQTDTIYKHYIQYIKTKPYRKSIYFVRGNDNVREELGTKMSNTPGIFQSLKWRQIMEITKSAIQKDNIREIRPDNSQIIKMQRKMEYSHTIFKQQPMCLGCLGCTSHFIKYWNIYEPAVQKTKLVMFGKVKDLINQNNKEQLQKIKRDLKKQICGLINCGGGVILFDCEKKYLDVYAEGYQISKNQAQTILNNIKTLVKQITPQPKIEQNIFISFVPVSKDPISQSNNDILKSNQQNTLLNFFKAYVTRIVVRPTIKSTYTYQQNGKKFETLRYKSIFNDDTSITQTEQIDKNVEPSVQNDNQEKLFGQKYQKQSQRSTNQDNEQTVEADIQMEAWIKSFFSNAYTDFDHLKCKSPLHGSGIPQEMSQQQLPDNQADIQQKFQYATAIVVKQVNFEQFKKKLQNQKFQHHLQFPFPNSKIKGTNATVLLYHNITPGQLKSTITQNYNYEFNGRKTVTVTITNHLKLITRLNKNTLPEQQLKNLQLWVDSQFKNENKRKIEIVPWMNEYKETEYYLKVVGNKLLKKCTLFIYLVCNHFNERVQFREPNMC